MGKSQNSGGNSDTISGKIYKFIRSFKEITAKQPEEANRLLQAYFHTRNNTNLDSLRRKNAFCAFLRALDSVEGEDLANEFNRLSKEVDDILRPSEKEVDGIKKSTALNENFERLLRNWQRITRQTKQIKNQGTLSGWNKLIDMLEKKSLLEVEKESTSAILSHTDSKKQKETPVNLSTGVVPALNSGTILETEAIPLTNHSPELMGEDRTETNLTPTITSQLDNERNSAASVGNPVFDPTSSLREDVEHLTTTTIVNETISRKLENDPEKEIQEEVAQGKQAELPTVQYNEVVGGKASTTEPEVNHAEELLIALQKYIFHNDTTWKTGLGGHIAELYSKNSINGKPPPIKSKIVPRNVCHQLDAIEEYVTKKSEPSKTLSEKEKTQAALAAVKKAFFEVPKKATCIIPVFSWFYQKLIRHKETQTYYSIFLSKDSNDLVKKLQLKDGKAKDLLVQLMQENRQSGQEPPNHNMGSMSPNN